MMINWKLEITLKFDKIWDNTMNDTKTEFNSKPMYDRKYLEIKMKSYGGKISTDFHDNRTPKNSFHLCIFH